ncbi:hypothetical protein [Vagococcus zengguangii]|uniref:Uncharacterized protein n=1 Tax=Vagococcus zengguangii TaxID=2571750 RepID=A0A4D7CZZ9_9ENTE|nr:hypothetical protein [Vagococcus zengguangii]QCI87290.1 hypothetical protein FA707_10330 [Vagococcus zengguangii]TLG79969.1 hypothetical protein FE258_06460 [Vagococcus zengguangii]
MSTTKSKISKKLTTLVLVLKTGLTLIIIATLYALIAQKYSSVLLGIVCTTAWGIVLKKFMVIKKEYETVLTQTLTNFTPNSDEQHLKD